MKGDSARCEPSDVIHVPLIFASCSAICSMSSRNLRNIIQVSIGNRSRSPLSPLSLRMMSRHDLTIDERRWAVVEGLCILLCTCHLLIFLLKKLCRRL
jgi:hypothetical protein